MKKLPAVLCIYLAFLLLTPGAQAWSGAGHQVIAAEAYWQLSPALRPKLTEILKVHLDCEKWKDSYTGEPGLDLGTQPSSHRRSRVTKQTAEGWGQITPRIEALSD